MTKKIKIRHKNILTHKAQKRYNTCKEQTYKLPVASWRKGKGEMTIEEIRKLISEAEYDYIGIRADDRDYQIGEVMALNAQSCYIHTFQTDLILDSMMVESLMVHAHLKHLRTTLKRGLKL